MLFATVGQGSVFLWMTLCGMMIGLMYDFFRLLRCILRAGPWLTLALDAIWGACGGVAMSVMLVIANRGALRPYVLLAVLAGFGVYMLSASRPILALGRWARIGVQKLSQNRLLRAVFR